MQWINCSDRLPTERDGDCDGEVIVRQVSGIGEVVFGVCKRWKVKNYDQWLEGACEEATGDVMRLDSVGRDVTCLPGLWDESDEIKKDESK